MKTLIKLFSFCVFFLFSIVCTAQIENVIVEKYYISDSNDATDTLGGGLETGSVTYRIFIDLKEGSRLKKIYGDQYHTFKIKSTENFFNNKIDGQTFAFDFNKNRLKENTVALDTWLTIGQITTIQTSFGMLKADDANGSIVGGINNDGGSSEIPSGLLLNNISEIGIPLTTSDGIGTKVSDSTNFGNAGIFDPVSNKDSTIFGSLKLNKEFVSNNFVFQSTPDGSSGVIPEKNHVLIAQLTTKGELSFELNCEVEINDNGQKKTIKYVANKDTLFQGEEISPYLTYPFLCGCRDANYIEYKDIFACDNLDSCKTKVVLGCMDSFACNFNPQANYNVKSLCCYPGFCNDRDLSIVCPQFNSNADKFYLYPNPANQKINFNVWTNSQVELKYSILSLFGEEVQAESSFGNINGDFTKEIELSNLTNGVYLFRLNSNGNYFKKVFIKQ
jgi:hypothetical protein